MPVLLELRRQLSQSELDGLTRGPNARRYGLPDGADCGDLLARSRAPWFIHMRHDTLLTSNCCNSFAFTERSAVTLLTPEAASQYLSVTKQSLAQLRYTGRGPTFRKLGMKTVRYKIEDLEAWIESTARTSTLGREAA